MRESLGNRNLSANRLSASRRRGNAAVVRQRSCQSTTAKTPRHAERRINAIAN
ncbi:MAG: hypothetical protein ACYT04_45115 [Nostoc sp.]